MSMHLFRNAHKTTKSVHNGNGPYRGQNEYVSLPKRSQDKFRRMAMQEKCVQRMALHYRSKGECAKTFTRQEMV